MDSLHNGWTWLAIYEGMSKLYTCSVVVLKNKDACTRRNLKGDDVWDSEKSALHYYVVPALSTALTRQDVIEAGFSVQSVRLDG